MNDSSDKNYVLPHWLRGWEQFWFTPADPTLLALIRMSCGIIVVYTLFSYSFLLQEFMGEHAWHDLQLRMDQVENRPMGAGPLDWSISGVLPAPQNQEQRNYLFKYRSDWGVPPPPPYPESEAEAKELDQFRKTFNVDLRANGLTPPRSEFERQYALEYTQRWHVPPPAYPKDKEEAKAIQEYMDRQGHDPRRIYARGISIFSLWFHILDPQAMAVVHGIIVIISILFTIGLGTRLTSALLWFGSLCYIHRNPTILFGVDTMITILLLYLMFSPCGAVYSVDRLIAKWWVGAKSGVVQWWYRLLRMPAPSVIAPADPVPDVVPPSIAANVCMRLLQIHVCIVYLMSGLSKLLGPAWWNGSAIWLAVANFEFAPMQFEWYLNFLRFLGSHQLLYDAFMSGGGMFTLAFEIGYAFLIWRPRLRWVFLAAAILLHGGIGLFMGLKTFSLMMLVMNMAFLRKEEAEWILNTLFDPRAVWRGLRGLPRS